MMTTSRAHEIMENELRCVQTASTNRCDRDCGKCPLVMDDAEIIEAYGMVIKMLETIKALEQEPCEDAISRQYLLDNCVVDKVTMPYVPISKIQEAPSVNPTSNVSIQITEREKYGRFN